MPVSTPACTHPPLPVHTVGVVGQPFNGNRYPTVAADVDTNGTVVADRIADSSGDLHFGTAALNAMKSWKFAPASAACVPVPGTVEYTVAASSLNFDNPCEHDAMATSVYAPPLPDVAKHIGAVDVIVEVSLDETGRIREVTIAQSSLTKAIDDPAKEAVRKFAFFPQVHQCRPVASKNLVRVTFSSY